MGRRADSIQEHLKFYRKEYASRMRGRCLTGQSAVERRLCDSAMLGTFAKY